MKKLLFALPFLFLYINANAYEPTRGYEKVTESDSGKSFFIHKKSIQRKSNFVYFWMESDSVPPRYALSASHTQAYSVIDCKNRLLDDVEVTIFSHAGDVLDSYSYKFRDWTPIAPGSVNEGLYKAVCKRELSL